jgi:hypothetical protein
VNLNLGLRALMARIHDMAKDAGYTAARVASKVNAHGELVIALLIPPRTPGMTKSYGRAAVARTRAIMSATD